MNKSSKQTLKINYSKILKGVLHNPNPLKISKSIKDTAIATYYLSEGAGLYGFDTELSNGYFLRAAELLKESFNRLGANENEKHYLSIIKDFLKEKTDRLYCKCEKVAEGKSDDVPRHLVRIVSHYGEKIFNEKKRAEAIVECVSKKRQLQKSFWDLKKEADIYQHKINQLLFWAITLPKVSDDYESFYPSVIWNSQGLDPKITREEGEILLDSYGMPQLRKYIEKKSIESTVEIPIAEERFSRILTEIKGITTEIRDIENSIKTLVNFGPFMESIDEEELNQDLSNKFKERMFLSRIGIRLKSI